MNVMKSSGHALSAQDERAISALLVSYGCAIDRRDWEKLRACFSDDCECDYGSFGKWQGPAAIVQYMKQVHADVGLQAQAVVQAGTHVFNGLFDLAAQGCFQLVDQSPVGFVECFFQCLAEAFIALALN